MISWFFYNRLDLFSGEKTQEKQTSPSDGTNNAQEREWEHISIFFSFTLYPACSNQREPSVPTLRSPLFADLWRHCVLSGGTTAFNIFNIPYCINKNFKCKSILRHLSLHVDLNLFSRSLGFHANMKHQS